MDAPAAVLALVLAMTATGASALLWFAPTWGRVRHGYEILTGSTVALLGLGAWASLRVPLTSLDGAAASAGATARVALLALTVLTTLAVVSLVAKLPPWLGRVLGGFATLAGLWSFVALAAVRFEVTGGGDHERWLPADLALGVTELLLGAVLMGAIWVGMILGHWYLVERRLSNRSMVWMAWANVVAIGAGLGSVLLSARNPAPCADIPPGPEAVQCLNTFAPVLRIEEAMGMPMTVVLGLGVLSLVALIAGFNVKLAREGGRSIQASTGMFYLAVILAPAVEFAAKVRFF